MKCTLRIARKVSERIEKVYVKSLSIWFYRYIWQNDFKKKDFLTEKKNSRNTLKKNIAFYLNIDLFILKN